MHSLVQEIHGIMTTITSNKEIVRCELVKKAWMADGIVLGLIKLLY